MLETVCFIYDDIICEAFVKIKLTSKDFLALKYVVGYCMILKKLEIEEAMKYGPLKKNTATFYRDEIEKIVKEEKIDRDRFHEFSKLKYEDIIKKFYYSFSDHNHFMPDKITLERKRMHIRSSVKSFVIAGIYTAESWAEYAKIIKTGLPLAIDEGLFFITSTGWVYQGYVDEIFQVLSKLDVWIGDFFIISSKFDWFIAHDYIDECAFMYQR